MRFVQVAGRLGVGGDVAEVQRAPLAVWAAHGVGHFHVCVHVGVAGAAGAMPNAAPTSPSPGTS